MNRHSMAAIERTNMNAKITQEPITLQWLLARGWTMTEAAERIGCTVSHLRRVIKGEREGRPTLLKLERLPSKKLTQLRRKKL